MDADRDDAAPPRPGGFLPSCDVPSVEATWSLPLAADLNTAPPPPIRRRAWAAVIAVAVLSAAAAVTWWTAVEWMHLRNALSGPVAPLAATQVASESPPVPVVESEFDRLLREGTAALQGGNHRLAQERFPAAARLNPEDALPPYLSGRCLLAHGDAAEASAVFDEALRIDPTCVEALVGRALARLTRNDLGGAQRDATAAVRLRPRTPQALVVRGRAQLGRGRDAEADADFAAAAALFDDGSFFVAPALATDFAERAWLYLQLDRFDEAAADAQTAVEMDRRCAAGYTQLARARRRQGRPEREAAASARALEALEPETAAEFVNAARAALEIGKTDAAVRACDAALARDPRNADAVEARARAWRRKGDRPKASADFARAARLTTPQYARDFLDRSALYGNAELFELALADADRAIALAPTLPAAYRRRGDARSRLKDFAGARADFRRALSLPAPQRSAAFLDRVWLCNETGDPDGALAAAARARSLGLRSGELALESGYAHARRKEFDAARAGYDEAIRLLPDRPTPFDYRGELSALRGEDAAARDDYCRALRLDPNDVRAYRGRAAVALRRGDVEAAVADYSAALRRDPDPRTYQARGRAFADSGDDPEAVRDFSKALALTSLSDQASLADLFNLRGVAFARLGDDAKAVGDYTRAIEHAPDDPVLYRNRAEAEERLGDPTAADADRKRAAQHDGRP
jgi:tetratricopeptide (TPR) repeat protein